VATFACDSITRLAQHHNQSANNLPTHFELPRHLPRLSLVVSDCKAPASAQREKERTGLDIPSTCSFNAPNSQLDFLSFAQDDSTLSTLAQNTLLPPCTPNVKLLSSCLAPVPIMPGLNETIPRPDSRELLPPLLACLSTAKASKDVPPGLLPLLSPILRQRVQLLSSNQWLPLLCWDQEVASRLPEVIEKINVEPHPSSGEIEVEEPDKILYRRSDAETLHAKLVLGEYGIIPTYLWCTGGEGGSRWLLAELRGLADAEDGTEWFESIDDANEAGFRRKSSTAKSNGVKIQQTAVPHPEVAVEEEEDDGSYWAAYDQTPGRTPQPGRSPAPFSNNQTQVGATQSELEYFARYASEVQPALDAHDPDEENPAVGESTLNGNALSYAREPQTEPLDTSNLGPNGYDSSMPPAPTNGLINGDGISGHDKALHLESLDQSQDTAANQLNHPRPSSSASSNSVERLERRAESSSQAELAIKQHISTDIKSLFRLARASGIDREEFERIIQRELEVLPMLEQE
jgi:hypothetical protein